MSHEASSVRRERAVESCVLVTALPPGTQYVLYSVHFTSGSRDIAGGYICNDKKFKRRADIILRPFARTMFKALNNENTILVNIVFVKSQLTKHYHEIKKGNISFSHLINWYSIYKSKAFVARTVRRTLPFVSATGREHMDSDRCLNAIYGLIKNRTLYTREIASRVGIDRSINRY